MRGRDDPHVDAYGTFAADPDDLAVLHDAQQADLRGQRELADLVEEERSAAGLFEPSLPASEGAGECALLVAEQLRVDQFGSDRAAVDAPEGPGAKRRVLMNGARDDFLAGAGLAEQQHRRAASRHQLGPRHHRGEAGVAADQPFIAGSPIAGNQVFGKRPGGRHRRGA
jgi:hypothetical protein